MPDVKWQVTGQSPATQTVNGVATNGMSITAQLVGSNASFKVFVPDSQYTADQVTALLADKANHVATVQAAGQ